MTEVAEARAELVDRLVGPRCVGIAPSTLVGPAQDILRRVAGRLAALASADNSVSQVAAIRSEEIAAASASAVASAALDLCIHVLCDLRAQGWTISINHGEITALQPANEGGAIQDEKARLRAAHLIERDAQLGQPSVRRFVHEMERYRLFRGTWHSVFSLIRDGRQLATQLHQATAVPDGPERLPLLREAIDPYVQVVAPGAVCDFTGLQLLDVWRYFRHTWTTTYQSTPGRKIFYLIRDRAAPNHPVIGIGAIGSAIVQLSVRDEWIGWTGPRVVNDVRANPSAAWARWLDRALKELLDGIFIDDFLKERVLRREDLRLPTSPVISHLASLSRQERQTHRLYPARAKHKGARGDGSTDWIDQARTHLFRSKRAAALAALLGARARLLRAGFTKPTARLLRQAVTDPVGAGAVETILRYVKAVHVGVDMMDVTVCGAVAPYNAILGGKLVSLLMASPAVTGAYNRRYCATSSVIASSMAGRAVRRTPRLVLLGTTSLYGVGASQYNRLRMPAEMAGGVRGEEIAYRLLGRTAGYGSYHFSQDTMKAIEVVLRQSLRGRPVNSIFGEGVNPKLRKVRSALAAVDLPADLLLQHGSSRLVYGIPLATNFRDVLLGRSRRPRYILPSRGDTTEQIVEYWCERWLSRRIERPDVLATIARQSLAHPVRHSARVVLPEMADEIGPLFG